MAQETMKENEAFFFDWRIENYTLCHQKRGSCLESPSFTMGILDKTKWHLCLYPRGKSDDFIVCDLYRENDSGSAGVTISTQFSFRIGGEISKYEFDVEKNSYSKTTSSSHKLMKRETLLLKKHLFLPRDVLTIHLSMWKDDSQVPVVAPTPAIKALVACLYDENEVKLPDSMYTTTGAEVMDLKKKLYPYLNECAARTRIGSEHVSFLWPIKNFSSLKGSTRLSVPLVPASKKIPPLILSVSLINNDDVQITVQKMAEKDVGEIFVIYRLAVMDISGRENIFAVKEHHFSSPTANEDWTFESFFKKSKMIEQKVTCLPNDILSLKCSFTISTGIEISAIVECNFVSLACEKSTDINEIGTLTDDMKTLYADKKLFDVNLRVKEKSLPAHKAVLASRSPVFRAMFEHDTREKNTNNVDIPDVDINTLAGLIAFIYSDDVGNLKPEGAIKLYTAADKYQIEVLRTKCSEFLISNISPENVYSILILADLHLDMKMKNAAEEFLFTPPYEELFSDRFDTFMQNHIHLARETLQRWVKKLKLESALESKEKKG
ncbi:Speckle-type POZ protein B [Araneus ventricosus]|uniref:Speckle-type POZ protein B n=1 Tax=Araneus ventricosus TaxID=182803 RepID=A0A4Y2SJB0_ARAVE|nr:Speckle-type POZ protein B [Araneus ventricosus]